jgi:hypothetical protein
MGRGRHYRDTVPAHAQPDALALDLEFGQAVLADERENLPDFVKVHI